MHKTIVNRNDAAGIKLVCTDNDREKKLLVFGGMTNLSKFSSLPPCSKKKIK